MFSVLNRDVLWGLGLWIAPHGLCKGIILLVESALQVDGSFDCGHTALLPVWMNGSKVMSCTKSLTGNKALQISLHCNWARNSTSLWTTSTGRSICRRFMAHLTSICTLVMLVMIDNLGRVGVEQSDVQIPVYQQLRFCPLISKHCHSFFHLALNYWALSFRGTSSPHPICRPSSLLHRSFTRGCSSLHVASWHWRNHSGPLLTSQWVHHLSLFKLFLQATPPNPIFKRFPLAFTILVPLVLQCSPL